ncbi:hypothetical protein OG900_04510 [Streptomyces sp. NBC_00433]
MAGRRRTPALLNPWDCAKLSVGEGRRRHPVVSLPASADDAVALSRQG